MLVKLSWPSVFLNFYNGLSLQDISFYCKFSDIRMLRLQDLVRGYQWLSSVPLVAWVAPRHRAASRNLVSSTILQTGGLGVGHVTGEVDGRDSLSAVSLFRCEDAKDCVVLVCLAVCSQWPRVSTLSPEVQA